MPCSQQERQTQVLNAAEACPSVQQTKLLQYDVEYVSYLHHRLHDSMHPRLLSMSKQ